MRGLVRIIIRKLINESVGKRKYQKIYELLHDIALRGMNYRSGNFKTSGEIEVIKLIAKKLNQTKVKGITVLDVGANIGDYTLELSERFPNDVKIYAFEPSRETFEILKQKVSGISQVQINNFGFSDSEAELPLYKDQNHNEMASIYQRDLRGAGVHMDHVETITVRTLDNFTSENNIDQINFLKIDVEGHELEVLKGGKRLLEKSSIDYIQFEFGEANIDSGSFLKNFYPLLQGYSLHRIVKDGIHPLGEYDTKNEIFKTVNLLAIRENLGK